MPEVSQQIFLGTEQVFGFYDNKWVGINSYSTAPLVFVTVDYLVVAGGGGGGANVGGGGGAGGLLSGSFTPVTASYVVKVGGGGATGGSALRGATGVTSSIDQTYV